MERLRAARLKAGLSQKQAAERLRRSQSYVSRSESGERRVDLVEALEFAALYGIAIENILPVLKNDET